MSKYVNVVTDNSVLVLDTTNGNQVQFFAGDYRYDQAVELLLEASEFHYEAIFALDTKTVINNFFYFDGCDSDADILVTIEDGIGYVTLYKFNGMKVELQSGLTRRIIKMSEQGFDSQPILNFIANLYNNPSATAVEELYGFIEACELPITEDGCFIAYKIVKNDYLDIYTGKLSNKVGKFLTMPRNMVDDDRNRTCSAGLHFCSKEYLQHYGTSSRNQDRCMLVKINPADVVSIPSDYNNAKGRTWQYEVVGEVAGEWRTWLGTKDFTTSAVVTSKAVPSVPVAATPIKSLAQDLVAHAKTVQIELESVFVQGYNDGWNDHLDGDIFIEADNLGANAKEVRYNDGYDQGFFDRKGKKARQYK